MDDYGVGGRSFKNQDDMDLASGVNGKVQKKMKDKGWSKQKLKKLAQFVAELSLSELLSFGGEIGEEQKLAEVAKQMNSKIRNS